uniref:Flavin-containing monooxygenase n=1 Tax=Panagrolaimus sp. JU765 TaxID=591449 RepID=A0AC34Q571_9BILA
MGKRVAIIGAGASGLPSIRHSLLYGIEPVCFECTEHVGGLWKYNTGSTNVHGQELSCVMKSTVINTSKEMTAFSDFPPPPEFANFMHNTKLYEYFCQYADHFGLKKYIKFKHFVKNVERADNYDQTGQWKVTYLDQNQQEHSEIFDGVLLATGHHAEPYFPPEWPGQSKFKGKIMHAHAYRDHVGLEDKVVAIVGVGNSGGDIAVELGRIAKQVYLVSRRGTWVHNRLVEHGKPFDIVLFCRWVLMVRNLVPLWLASKYVEWRSNREFDHVLYGLKPEHGIFAAHPTVNDDLPNRLANGTVIVTPNIREFNENGLIFENGKKVDKVDVVILSTGYSFGFKAAENGKLIPTEENEVTLYKYMYPPNLSKHNTLAVIGCIQPLGSIMPISEMQVRVFFEAFTKKVQLPTEEEMLNDINQKKYAMRHTFVHTRRHTIQVDYANFMDELADLINCKPSITEYAFTDPQLALKLLEAPVLPYTYRLKGPHPWEGARRAIFDFEKRVKEGFIPLGGVPQRPQQSMLTTYVSYALALIVFVLSIWGFYH